MDVIGRNVTLPCDDSLIAGSLDVPPGASGLVVFAHCAANSRFSPRNVFAGGYLLEAGLATFILDLITAEEALAAHEGARVPLSRMVRRLGAGLDWLAAEPSTCALPVGLFGAGMGAAVALLTAAARGEEVAAIVVRGARTTLVPTRRLTLIEAPTLLIVGEEDAELIPENREAYAALRCPRRLDVIPGASHLFDDRTTFAAMMARTRDWFTRELAAHPRRSTDLSA